MKRNKRWSICIMWVVASFWILPHASPSFAQQKDAGPAVQAQTKSETQAEASKGPGAEKAATESKEEKYGYNPDGKTDPFESFLKKPRGGTGTNLADQEGESEETAIATGEPQTELERIELSKLTLTSVIRGENRLWAMVIDPKGRGYFLEKGTKIGTQSGIVDEIICEERRTEFGVDVVRKVVVKVPYRDRNRNIIYRSIEMEMPHTSM
jgi:hypothetical protein